MMRGIFRFIAQFFLIAMLVVCSLSWAEEDNRPYVEVIKISGSAEALLPPSNGWTSLQEGAVLHSEDSVKTSANSYVEIAFDEDKIVRIEPDSYVTILLQENEKLQLVSGAVYAAVKKLPPRSSFEIRTPIAMSGARGTDWLTKVEGSDMIVEAYEDMPFVRTIQPDGTVSQEEVRIGPGYQTKVPRFGAPEKFTKIPPESMNEWRQWKQDLAPRVEKAASIRRDQGRKLGGDIRPALKKDNRPNLIKNRKPESGGTQDRGGRLSYLNQGLMSQAQQQAKSVSKNTTSVLDNLKASATQKSTSDNAAVKKREAAKVKCCPSAVLKSGASSRSIKK